MFLCDYHTHTTFSFDAAPEATHDAMCRRALELGLSDIAFTDHCDINGEVEGIYPSYRAAEAFASMQAAKEAYKGRLNVLCGIELGNAHQYPAEAAAILAAHPYDFVINSLHNLRDVPDFCMLKYEMMTDVHIASLFDRLLDESIGMVVKSPRIDTLGHLTYMNRYVSLAQKPFSFKPHYDKIKTLYRTLIERDIALEVNVSTLWTGLGVTMPSMELLKLYADCGGRLVTIGSDAHRPADLAKGIRKGYALLATVGLDQVMTIRDGERVMQSIL